MVESTNVNLGILRQLLAEDIASVSVNSDLSPDTVNNQTPSERDISPNILLQWLYDEEIPVRPRKDFYTVVGKRCIDIVVSSLVIVFVLLWLTPLIALLLYIDSPGPFYFKQKRTGARGRPFTCFKFRTMIAAQPAGRFRQTAKDDPRVTKLGGFLRKTNIDEMLQFINVLIGDMTLIGPRPHAILHDAMHWQSPSYRARYLVKPGITGLAQIRGSRGITDQGQLMEHRVKYDHFYINRQTFFLDAKIFLETIRLTVQGDSNAW